MDGLIFALAIATPAIGVVLVSLSRLIIRLME